MVKRKDVDSDVELDDTDVVNVDFDFFDLVEDDFLSIKSLVRQLLGLDNVHFNLSEITQLVMEAKVGTTIKADDEEYNDALAVLAITDFDLKRGEAAKLLDYWLEVIDTPEMLRALHKIKASGKKIGLLVSERFLNMPYEVVPPLFSVLTQEYAAKKLDYDYLILPSRVYAQKESELDGETKSKTKRGSAAASTEYFPFHVEDTVINKLALAATQFTFKTPVEETDSRRAFQDYGIHPYGHLAVFDAKKLEKIAEAVADAPNVMED